MCHVGPLKTLIYLRVIVPDNADTLGQLALYDLFNCLQTFSCLLALIKHGKYIYYSNIEKFILELPNDMVDN